MNIKRLIALLMMPIAASAMQTNSNLVLTTALVKDPNGVRKQEYEKSFAQFKKFGYEHPYIVEGVQPAEPSYLDEHTLPERLYYFPDNKPTDHNRGKFEGLSLREALKKFQLPAPSYVYKQTGRYLATKNLAAEITKNYPGYNLYIRRFPGLERVMLAAFVMNAQKMQQMYENLDYEAMEREWSAVDPERCWIENYATIYLKQAEQESALSVCYLPSGADDFPLGIILNPAHSSTGVTQSQTRY